MPAPDANFRRDPRFPERRIMVSTPPKWLAHARPSEPPPSRESKMGLRNLLDRAKKYVGKERFDQLWYHLVYNSNLWTDSTFNYGYCPAEAAVLADPVGRSQPYQIQMYLEAARTAGDPEQWLKGKRLLEMSCGRGGGLSFINRTFAPSEAVGLDLSGAAIRRARARDPNCTWVDASVLNMPFEANSFDAIICVEALHHYRMECTDEVKRVLRPGGLCIIADSLAYTPRKAQISMTNWLGRMGFQRLEFRDITASVAEACAADTQRRLDLINRSPFFVRKLMLELTGAAGTDRHQDFLERRRTFFIIVGKKPEEANTEPQH
jgi:SAM-dependent methyltransferase